MPLFKRSPAADAEGFIDAIAAAGVREDEMTAVRVGGKKSPALKCVKEGCDFQKLIEPSEDGDDGEGFRRGAKNLTNDRSFCIVLPELCQHRFSAVNDCFGGDKFRVDNISTLFVAECSKSEIGNPFHRC